MNIEDLKKYLSHEYQGSQSFLENIIYPIFGEEEFIDGYETEILDGYPEYRKMADATGIRSVKDVGMIYIDGEPLQIFDISVSDRIMMERNRVTIQSLVRRIMDQYSNAFMLFHYENITQWNWRFTYCHKSANKEESTDSKRYTFLLGPKQSCRTAADNFVKLYEKRDNLEIEDIEHAFSVEALSDRFFNEYKEIYSDIIFYTTGKRMVKVGGKWEEQKLGPANRFIKQQFAHFDDPEKAIRDYVKKLMGRLVFLQFLQKKGWLGVPSNKDWGEGDGEFIQNLFTNYDDQDNFIDDVLEKLFNDLNTERKDDISKINILGYKFKVPYLNGGLFERDATDKTIFPLPAKYMQRMLDFFSYYNFTIDENDPNDAEVGVDPEMLGRIFENLLEDNKDKGAFYTPKEIVTYMCRESLIAYLQTGIKKEAIKEDVRKFVTTHDVLFLGTNTNGIQQVDEALKNVKICDPAIGSGAFPMGLLKELYLCRSAIEGLDDDNASEIKKHIIQHNIYGVDIDKGAVDIARLRFWLSLIVDEKTPHALPNLDFKIMHGNSLLEQYKGVDLSTVVEKKRKGEVDLFEDMVDVLRSDLRKLLATYYECTDHKEKKALRKKITDNVKQQLLEQGITVNLGDIDLAGNDQFMLWHTWFHDVFSQGGFDIVIGNPPYVSAQNQIANSFLATQREKIIKSRSYNTLNQKWDLYIPFMERGIDYLCIENGIVSMIVPYPLTNQIYAEKLRKKIVCENSMYKIVDLKGTKIFENATVENCIPFVRKSNSSFDIEIAHINDYMQISTSFIKKIEDLLQDNQTQVWNLTQESRRTDRHSKLHVLGDFCYISKGMVLNADEITAKGEFKKEDLISLEKDDKHPRKYIEGKDLNPYCVLRTRYLEYDTKRVPSQVSRPTFRELYERDKIMFNCLGTLKSMVDIGQHYLHNDSIICGMLWSNLSDIQNRSVDGVVNKYSSYNRDELEEFSKLVRLKYLLGLLNSKYANKLLNNLRGGGLRIYPDHIRNLPIPIASNEQQKSIISIVDKILDAKRKNPTSDTNSLELEIDRIVYKLYDLTYDEVLIVDPETPITREEYESNK